MSWMYRAGRAATRFCLTFFGRLEVTGQECVPPHGPLIVISNHLSYNDPSVLFVGLPRSLNYLGKVELFSNPVKKTIMRWVGVFPLERGSTGVDGMRTALSLLAQDRALVIFPEGRISLDKSLERAKGGCGFSGHQVPGSDSTSGYQRNGKVFTLAHAIPLSPLPGEYWPALYTAGAGGTGWTGGDQRRGGNDDEPHRRSATEGVSRRLCPYPEGGPARPDRNRPEHRPYSLMPATRLVQECI